MPLRAVPGWCMAGVEEAGTGGLGDGHSDGNAGVLHLAPRATMAKLLLQK